MRGHFNDTTEINIKTLKTVANYSIVTKRLIPIQYLS